MKGVNFKILSEKGQEEVIKLACLRNSKFHFWIKGENSFNDLKIERYDLKKKTFILESESSKINICDLNLLCKMEIDGVYYFGEGKLNYLESNDRYGLHLAKGLYECERRKWMRLEVYHLKNFSIQFTKKNVEEKISYKRVLILVNEEKSSQKDNEHFNKTMLAKDVERFVENKKRCLKIFDISSKGLSFVLGEIEKDEITVNEKLEDVFIQLGEHNFSIPEAEIIRIKKFEDFKRPKAELFLVGINFIGLDKEIQMNLEQIILSILSRTKLEENFETYLKDE